MMVSNNVDPVNFYILENYMAVGQFGMKLQLKPFWNPSRKDILSQCFQKFQLSQRKTQEYISNFYGIFNAN